MKLSKHQVQWLDNLLKVARIVGIEDVIVQKDTTRAVDSNQTTLIFHPGGMPDMPCDALGLTRTNVLQARLDLMKDEESFVISLDVDTSTDTSFCRSMKMSSGKVAVDYRCGHPATIRAPKVIHGDVSHTFTIPKETIALMQRGQSAMSADTFSLILSKGVVEFELKDINGDVMVGPVTSDVNTVDGQAAAFHCRYPAKSVLSILKYVGDVPVSIVGKGMLKFEIDGIVVYILSQRVE